MYGPEGNSFVSPRVLVFPSTSSRETLGLALGRFEITRQITP